MAESNIQQNCFIWFHNNFTRLNLGVMFSVANESTYNNRKFKNTGVLPGVSDTIVVLPDKVIFVEFKTSTGKQSEAQINFENKVTELGHEYILIRNLDEFKRYIGGI